jgi:hypothetical protein
MGEWRSIVLRSGWGKWIVWSIKYADHYNIYYKCKVPFG